MKKILGLLIVAMLAFTVMAGVASAGTLTYTGSVVGYPYEASACSVTLNLNNGALTNAPTAYLAQQYASGGGLIQYVPTVDLPSGTRIIFTLTNATFADTKYYLLYDSNVLLPEAATTDGTVLGTNTATFVVGLQPIPANTILDLSTGTGGITNPSIVFAATTVPTWGGSCAGVTLAINTCYDSVGPLASCLAPAINLVCIYKQFSFQTVPYDYTQIPVTATIDVSPSDPADARKEFCTSEEGCPEHNGGHSTVRAFVGLLNEGIYNYTWRISIEGAPTGSVGLSYTINGAQMNKLSVLNMQDGYEGYTVPFLPANNDTSRTATLPTSGSGTWVWHDTHQDYVVMTVDGTDILNPQSFNLSAALDFKGAACMNNVTFAASPAIIWNINGWQGTIPYMWASSDPTQDTFCKIFNNSAINGQVTADVTSDDGSVVATVSLGTLDAGTVGIFWADNIATLAGVTVPGAFATVITVNAPRNSVTAMCDQKRSSGNDRVVPVYTGDDYLYYKNW